MAAQGSILGNAVTRKEDPGLLTGSNDYISDLDIDAAQVIFVRSTMAHASLLEVDTSEATSMPGVLAVYTADNLEIAAVNQSEFMDPSMNRPPLAVGRVRFVGDIVAAVVAETHSQAVDAAEQVVVDYDPLPANVDIEAAAAEGAQILWEGADSNVCFAIGNEYDGPDVTDGADAVVSERIVTQRLAGVPMEANGCLAIPEGDSMTFYASTQTAHGLRDALAPNIGMEPENLHVIAPW
ncbi:MAG: molybdopterin cofactor-binding domain-containing protein, partial [Actinomycetota bacterium]|nr:molybdopterin cofactor-binding domain-containing protein [Actinomycetota bacterium]